MSGDFLAFLGGLCLFCSILALLSRPFRIFVGLLKQIQVLCFRWMDLQMDLGAMLGSQGSLVES